MKKTYHNWTIKELINKIDNIDFPEFQRDPNVWNLEKKQRLIDSIFRDFDIASIYFYFNEQIKSKRDKRVYDCIDGQQRINAIWSYVGINANNDSEDNNFHLTMKNEIYVDDIRFKDINNKRFPNLPPDWQDKLLNYKLNIVIIDESDNEDDLNLQFLRLQLGAALNGGEKLNAMRGDMRDFIFIDLEKEDYLNKITIQRRRFAKEQVAAQIAINVFSLRENDSFHRSRYEDLQIFFKSKEKFSSKDRTIISEIKDRYQQINICLIIYLL